MSEPVVQISESSPARHAGRWVVSAPAQISLIGDDGFCCDSFVLPAAIGLRVRMAADRRTDSLIVLSPESGPAAVLNPAEPPAGDAPALLRLLHGVLREYTAAGAAITGLDVRISSTIPEGAGLGRSAAMQVCFATLLECASGFSPGHPGKVKACRESAESCGLRAGPAAHFCAVHARSGHAMLLDCRHQRADHIPLGNAALLLLDTGIRGKLTGLRAARRGECAEAARALGVSSLRELTMGGLSMMLPRLQADLAPRVRHMVTEITRAICAAESARHCDWSLAGQLISASHASLRDDFDATIPEVDFAASCVQAMPGVAGSRCAGDGCCVAVVDAAHAEATASAWATAFGEKFGTRPVVHITAPCEGSRLEKSGDPLRSAASADAAVSV